MKDKSDRISQEIKETYDHYYALLSNKRPDLLNAEEEIELSNRIKKARNNLWLFLLNDPKDADFCTDFISQKIESLNKFRSRNASKFVVDLGPFSEAAKLCLADANEKNVKAYESEQRNLAETLSGIDTNNQIAKTLLLSSLFENREELKEGRKLLATLTRLKNKFFYANIFLALRFARKYGFGKVSFDDIAQQSMIGLMVAIEKFDVDKGCRFSTYAAWWIKHYIVRYVENTGNGVRIPTHVQKDLLRIKKTIQKIKLSGVEPTSKLIADNVGLSKDKVEEIIGYDCRINSIHDKKFMADDVADDIMVPQALIDGEDLAEEKLEKMAENKSLKEAIGKLSEREQFIINHRYGFSEDGEAKKLQQIGDMLSLSRERIRVIQRKAEEKIKTFLENQS